MKLSTRANRALASLLSLSMVAGPAFAGPFTYQVPVNGVNLAAATAGQLTLTPGSKDFGTVILGGSAGVSVTVTNTGQDSVTLSGIDTAAPFAQSNNCPGTLVGGASCSVAVTYVPAAAGDYAGALTLNNSAGPASMSLTGRAVAPTTNLGLSASSMNFPAAKVGESAPVQKLIVTNNGNSPATVSGIGVSSGSSDFSQANNCGSVMNPGDSCTLNISFAPSAYGARTGTVNVYEEISGTLYSVALQGFGNAAVMAVSTTAVTYPDTVVGYPSTRKVTVTNTGNEPMTGLAANVPTADFNVSESTCAATLSAGDSCDLTLAFSPNSAGNKAATLNVTAANSAARAVSLSGKANAQAPALSASPVAFGALNVGDSASRTVTVSNTGNVPATVSGLSVVSGASDYTQTNNCATVPVGSSCSIDVKFVPSARGQRNGAVYLAYGTGLDLTVGLTGQGLQGVSSLSSLTADFGSVKRDQAAAATTLTLTNTGDAPLTVAGVTAPASSDFRVTSACATVAIGASCSITLNFTPTALGVRDSVLTVQTAAGSQSVDLKGIGVNGQASVTPSALTFSNQQVATTSGAQTVTVSNTGSTTLQFTGVSVISGASDFAQSNNCASVPVGGTCTVTVAFTPSTSGERTGTVALVHDGDGVTTVSLTGAGQAQSASITAPAFGSQQVGTSASGVATLTNTGVGPLSVTVPTAAALTGADYSFVSTTCTTSLAVGASCTTSVSFTPSAQGSRSGSLTVSTGAGAQVATLSGTGVQGTASVTPSALTFVAQQVAATSSAQAVTVTNTGTSPLVFTGVGVVAGASDFAQSNNCATVAVNASCSINVAFTPSTTGARSGTVALTHNGGGVTTVALSGTGQAQSATLSVPTFSTTAVGGSSVASAILSNTGIGPVSVTVPAAGSVTGTDFSFDSTTCASSLAAGATCLVTVKFSPTSTAARTGNLLVTTTAGAKNASLAATGVQGSASVSPSSLTFVAQQVSSSSSAQVITVTNSGTSTLHFSGVGMATGSSDFGQSNNCANVAVGSTCAINVTFTPSTAGSRTGTVALTHDGGGVTTVGVSGTGQAQSASLSTPSFASTPVGSSNNATATLSNTGIGTLSIVAPTSAAVTGADFSFVSTTCGTSLAVSGTCTVTVKFSPTSTSARSGTLSISTGAGTQSVTLGSTGIQGFASVSPSSLTFATQQIASTSTAQVVTVTNTGTNTLTFSGVGIATGASDFGQSNNCGAVPVNGTCSINVSFTPSTSGSRTGTLALTHNGGGIATVSLTGTGQGQSASLSTPSFANTIVGSNTTATATLSNTGLGALDITVPTAASVTGTDFSFVSTTCGTSLAVSGTCTVSVKFTPTANVARSGSLSFSTGGGTMSAALSATGIQGTTSLSPTSLSFSAQQVGTSTTKTVTVTNSGTSTLTLSSVSVTAGSSDYSLSHNCTTLAPSSGSCTVTVTFAPSAAGTRTGTVTLSSDGSNPSATVSLSGTSQTPSASLSVPTLANTQTGQTTTGTATLTNTGIAAISVTAPSAASVTGTDFSFVSTTCGTSLAASATCTTTVRFSPTSGVARTGSLSIGTGAGTQTVTLSATGVNQSVVATGAQSFTFNVAQSTGSGHYIGVQNNGIGPITVNSLSSSATAGNFNAWWAGTGSGAAGGYCENGQVLQPGQYCGAWANGDGSAGATSSGTATITTSAGSITFTGSFTVKGIAYSGGTGATLAPTAGQSGTLYNLSIVNSTPFTYYFPMYSVYGGATRIGRLTGANASNFVITSTTCGGSLAPGGTCTVAIAGTGMSSNGTYTASFQPNGTYQQAGDGGNGSWAQGYWLVNMGTTVTDVYVSPNTTVNATVQSAALSYSPSSIAFGNVQVGQSSSQTFTITNTGNITATGLAGVAVAGYSMVPSGASPCSSSLAAGASCTATATFTPTAVQAYNGNYGSSGSNISTAYMPVSGAGVAPSLTLMGYAAGGTSALGTIGRYSDSGRWPVYKNTGVAPVVITAHSATGGFWAWQGDPNNAAYCSPNQTLAVGASCQTFVGLSNEVGDYSGTETLNYTGAGSSTSYAINTGFSGSVRTTTANVSSVAFGTQSQNQWNGPMYVRITNNATNNVLRNLSVSLSGGNAGNFSIGSYNCSGGGLSGGAYCDIPVYFNPTWSANGFSTTLVITGGYPRMEPSETTYVSSTGVSISIPLSGNGAFSQATVTSANAQDFGGGWYGQGWTYLNWTYRNDGNVNMTLASPSVSAPLAVNSNGCSNIAPGASCTIQLVNQWNNDSAPTNQTFNVTGATINPGTATAYYTVYSAVPVWGNTNIAFGNVNVGSSSTIPVTLYNYGSHTPYNWAANNNVANLPADFSVNLANCSSVAQGSGSAQQGGSCTAYVTFTPSTTGARGGGSVYVAAASYGISGTWATFSGTGTTPPAPFSSTATPGYTQTTNQTGTSKTGTITWTFTNPAGSTQTPTAINAILDSGSMSVSVDTASSTCKVGSGVGSGASCTVVVKASGSLCTSATVRASITSANGTGYTQVSKSIPYPCG
jgi:hypothetical protein